MAGRRGVTTKRSAGSSHAAQRPTTSRWLFLVGEGHCSMHALPAQGELVLGRDEECEISLPHAKISRRHARVTVAEGIEVMVEDLGSTNGIRVGQRRLERGVPVPLSVGESLQLGPYSAMLVDGASGRPSTDGGPRAAVVVRDPSTSGASELLRRVAKSGISVLVVGETGTGKEVLSRTIHELSGRTGQLVAINCAALGETLLESELFGHERGAFTGAVEAKPGLLEVSHRGTMLLDEIGDLSLSLQAKLLRALETGAVQRVGGLRPIPLDLRVIAATHRDLPADAAAGRFRQDLYFRLNGITLRIPPLHERRDAIPGLVTSFLVTAAKAQGLDTAPLLEPAALARLVEHDWPGNVRELRKVIERALLLSDGRAIGPRHLVLDAAARAPTPSPAGDSSSVDAAAFAAAALACRGNVSALARSLKTSQSQVRRLAKRFGVDLHRFRENP
jgi:two-component system, NtrC family, response regulator AtoC